MTIQKALRSTLTLFTNIFYKHQKPENINIFQAFAEADQIQTFTLTVLLSCSFSWANLGYTSTLYIQLLSLGVIKCSTKDTILSKMSKKINLLPKRVVGERKF